MLIAVAGVLLSSIAADAVASAGRIRSGVDVGTLKLGGRTLDEASRLLEQRAKLLATTPASYANPEKERVTLTPESVQYFPDVDATLADAKKVGREGSIVVKIWQRVRSYVGSSNIRWRTDIDRAAAKKIVDGWGEKFDNPGHEAGIEAKDGKLVPVAPLPGRTLDRDRALATMVAGLNTWPRRTTPLPFSVKGRKTDMKDAEAAAERANELVKAPITLTSPAGSVELKPEELAPLMEAVPRKRFGRWELQLRFSPDRVKADLSERMKPFEKQPRDARFTVSGSSVDIVPSEDGLGFDAAKTAEALDKAAELPEPRTTEAAFTVERPKLSTEEARGLRIKEMVSTFTTRHPAGQPRVKNIHIMADTVDGTVVKPGETFSLNKKAGERTTDKGYVSAPMIYDGEFKDEIGGGVSQFATTIYNAVFFGGYDFVSYKAHSYYISRYPPGREATVSWPAPDFKFRNDSSAGILIKTAYSSTSITVTFYGDKEGKKVEAQAEEKTNVKPPPEKRVADPSMPPGSEHVTQGGADGFDIVVWRIITDKDGKSKREKFFTRYLPEPRIISYGPGSPQPSPTPAPGGPAPAPGGPTQAPATPAPTPRPTPTPTRGPI